MTLALTFRGPTAYGSGKGAPLTAGEVDANFVAIEAAVNALLGSGIIPRAVQSISVTGDQMTITATDGTNFGVFTLPKSKLNPRGAWATATAYLVNDTATINGNAYVCASAHTSGTFATDLANGLWQLFAQGNTGPTGSQGPIGNTGPAGPRFAFNARGAWATSTAYAVNDLVSINNASYSCIVAHTSGTFATDLANGDWQLLAQGTAGTNGTNGGTGPTGPTGPAGSTSFDGTNKPKVATTQGAFGTATTVARSDHQHPPQRQVLVLTAQDMLTTIPTSTATMLTFYWGANENFTIVDGWVSLDVTAASGQVNVYPQAAGTSISAYSTAITSPAGYASFNGGINTSHPNYNSTLSGIDLSAGTVITMTAVTSAGSPKGLRLVLVVVPRF